ncbi:MAG: DNA-directed RNA polymerase subunit alpha [Endomicrobium sp.]|jgi:DNA-directed RNA polymerase subunit alpha|nr:DNA-directed RNA polymerase subunit alpha [Endomicrobium sp.]
MKSSDLEKLCKLVLDENSATKFYGRFIAEPFERGYGHTIGNSLRRILLSSIEGAAITSVKIAGALHEFTVLKGVKEDVAQIILNLKKIRVKLYSVGSEKLYLKANKAGKVTAKDIEVNANVEMLNFEQEIANIDNDAELEMELEVSSGKGYVLAEELISSKHSVGTINLDCLFSPVTKVNYEVENTRVEQSLNYDRLIMEIWTDGSISPQESLARSAIILSNKLMIFTGNNIEFDGSGEVTISDKKNKKKILSQSVSVMDLSVRVLNSLKNAGIETIGDLVSMTEKNMLDFYSLKKRSFDEVKSKLEKLDLHFGMEIEYGEKE